MRLGSETAYRTALDSWDALLRQIGQGERDFARELFAVADVYASSPALAAALEDSSRDGDARAALASNVVDGKVSGEVKDLLAGLARESWSEEGDLIQAIHKLAVQTLLAGAQRENKLDQLEEELYSIRASLQQQSDLRNVLRDDHYEIPARQELADKVFPAQMSYTADLLHQALAKTPDVSLHASLSEYIAAIGERSEHIVASVTAAIPLSRKQEERLAAILSKKYGSDVSVHTTIDTSVIGGMRVLIGSDVIDGTISRRLDEVKEVFSNGR